MQRPHLTISQILASMMDSWVRVRWPSPLSFFKALFAANLEPVAPSNHSSTALQFSLPLPKAVLRSCNVCLFLLREPMICLVMAQWLAILTTGAMVEVHFKNVFHKCLGHTSRAWASELAALPGIGIALGVALPLPVAVGAWHDAIIDHTCQLQSTHAFHMFDNTCWQHLMPRMHWHWIALGHSHWHRPLGLGPRTAKAKQVTSHWLRFLALSLAPALAI